MVGPSFLASEPRLKVGILLRGGLPQNLPNAEAGAIPDDLNAFNYAPCVTVPVLMLNGRHDPIYPYETNQVPLYERLGTAPEHKRHITFPSGHSSYGWRNELFRHGLDWLDTYFGPPLRN